MGTVLERGEAASSATVSSRKVEHADGSGMAVQVGQRSLPRCRNMKYSDTQYVFNNS